MDKISIYKFCGIHWDMRHVVETEYNFYPVDPTAEEVLEVMGL
jgi:hypothetical protein